MTIEEEERAAIMEYDGNMPREDAEILAVLGVPQESLHPWRCQCNDCVAAGRATVLG